MATMMLLAVVILTLMAVARAEEQKPTGEAGQEDTSAETENTDTPSEPMIPKSRFDQVNRRLKELESSQKEIEAATKKAEEERLAKDAEWQQLAETRETQRVEAVERAVKAEAALRGLQLQQGFTTEALKASIPPDRIGDAFQLAEWPDGDEEPDFAAVVKDLTTAKPWLIGAPAATETSAERGRVSPPEASEEAQERKSLLDAARDFLPRGLNVPSQ
jgi:hypothetical protein